MSSGRASTGGRVPPASYAACLECSVRRLLGAVPVAAALALTLVVALALVLALDGTAALAFALVHGLATLFAVGRSSGAVGCLRGSTVCCRSGLGGLSGLGRTGRGRGFRR